MGNTAAFLTAKSTVYTEDYEMLLMLFFNTKKSVI